MQMSDDKTIQLFENILNVVEVCKFSECLNVLLNLYYVKKDSFEFSLHLITKQN